MSNPSSQRPSSSDLAHRRGMGAVFSHVGVERGDASVYFVWRRRSGDHNGDCEDLWELEQILVMNPERKLALGRLLVRNQWHRDNPFKSSVAPHYIGPADLFELEDLIKEQTARIEELEQKIEDMEAHAQDMAWERSLYE